MERRKVKCHAKIIFNFGSHERYPSRFCYCERRGGSAGPSSGDIIKWQKVRNISGFQEIEFLIRNF